MESTKNKPQKCEINLASESITVAVEKWLVYNQRYAQTTQRQYRDTIRTFVNGLPAGIKTIVQLNANNLRDYLSSLLNRGLKGSSVNARLTVLQSFCRWLSKYYNIDNIAHNIRRQSEEVPEQRYISEEEYDSILAVCKPGEKAVIQLIANTGIKASEFFTLSKQNVSCDQQYLTITEKARERKIPLSRDKPFVEKGKRIIPLNDTCRKIINSSYFFSKRYKNKDALFNLCRSLSKRAKIPLFGPEALRLFFAMQLIQARVSITKVSLLLGHSSIRTTERYIHSYKPDDYVLGITDVLSQTRQRKKLKK